MKRFSQFRQREGNRFKQRLVPFFNGVYGIYAKLRRAVGNPIVISDASDEPLSGLKVFGKSTQNGTPTPNAPVEIVSVENPTVKVDTQSLSVPYTLHGIPVTSGGNYTDADGQQWICDEVDFERGVYVQRTKLIDLKTIGAWETWGVNYQTQGNTGFYSYDNELGTSTSTVLCTIAEWVRYAWGGKNVGANISTSNHQYISVTLPNNVLSDVSTNEAAIQSFKKLLVETNAKLLVNVKPIETPLTADQIEAYKALHTNEPNTTILNDQNAWMEVSYISN